jgi:hypothetical protein
MAPPDIFTIGLGSRQAGKAASPEIVHLVSQMVTKAVQQFLRSLKIGTTQPFGLGAILGRDQIQLAPHVIEQVATTGSSSFGELKLLDIMGQTPVSTAW